MTLEYHPLANLFPLIEGVEFDGLVAGMKADGFRSGEEIVLYEGKILDGRNRYRAGLAAGIFEADEAPITSWHFVQFSSEGLDGTFTDAEIQAGPLAYVLAKNLWRRHLDEGQRAMLADRIATMRPGSQPSEPANWPVGEESTKTRRVRQADAAKSLAVSERSVRRARVVREKGTPELIAAVDQGRMAVSLAAQAALLPVETQLEVVAEVAAGRANAVRTVVKRESRTVKEKELSVRQKALPDKRYGVILADPEWRFEPYSRESGMDRAPENHYPTSPTELIAARDVASIAAEHCVLFLWATGPMIEDALMVMRAWGFEYKSQLVWVKDRPGNQRGPGHWFSGEHELLLLGTKGSPPAPAPGTQWRSVIMTRVGEHSEKPDVVHSLIETYFPNLPKIELNARLARQGWDCWGLEAPEVVPEQENDLDARRAALTSEHGLIAIDETHAVAADFVSPDEIVEAERFARAAAASRARPEMPEIPEFLRRSKA